MNGVSFRDHHLTCLWDRQDPSAGECEIYARELYRDPSLPALLYLQGGPGCAAPRPTRIDGWLAEALKHYRVILLDQRGTGRSGRIDRYGDARFRTAPYLKLLQAPHIVADAEELREYLGIDRWDVLGQSFGGFCLTAYLSTHPERIRHGFFTGGLPATTVGADIVYRATFAKLIQRHEQFYEAVPWAERRIREICDHLNNADERLPTGERLSSRRFRTIGIELGRSAGFVTLAALLEEPFHHFHGHKRLRGDFLAAVGARVSFEATPLYATIHESIYGGFGATAWSAHRVREEIDGFAENADPASKEPFYLTGEHIFPWQFEEDPALRPFAVGAQALADATEWPSPYDRERLAHTGNTNAALVYRDDIFVPKQLSLSTAAAFEDLHVWMSDDYQHDGLRVDGAHILAQLRHKVGLAE